MLSLPVPGLEDEKQVHSHVSAPLRCNLASVLLQLLAMKVPNVLTFDFMSKPSPGRQHLQWSSGGLGG